MEQDCRDESILGTARDNAIGFVLRENFLAKGFQQSEGMECWFWDALKVDQTKPAV